MNVTIHIQNESDIPSETLPSRPSLTLWTEQSIINQTNKPQEVTVRFVTPVEMQQLNSQYRGKDRSTNVLSFYYDVPENVGDEAYLGDLVLCPDVILKEADTLAVAIDEYWARMVVHGLLHLQGYVHATDPDFKIMAAEESRILQCLHFSNPYVEEGIL